MGGFDEGKGDINRAAKGMTTTAKTEHSTTREQRLGAALRDNLRRRKTQSRSRAKDGKATAVAEPEGGDTGHESEADG